jgi:hypothetical protein
MAPFYLQEKFKVLLDFMQNMKQLNDTLPPMFLALTQLHFILNDPRLNDSMLLGNDRAIYQIMSNNPNVA